MELDADDQYVLEMGAKYPAALKRLWIWAKDALREGNAVCFELSKDAFGYARKQYMFLNDIHVVCAGGEICGSVICIFIQ